MINITSLRKITIEANAFHYVSAITDIAVHILPLSRSLLCASNREAETENGSQDTISLLDHYIPNTNNLVRGDVKVNFFLNCSIQVFKLILIRKLR